MRLKFEADAEAVAWNAYIMFHQVSERDGAILIYETLYLVTCRSCYRGFFISG